MQCPRALPRNRFLTDFQNTALWHSFFFANGDVFYGDDGQFVGVPRAVPVQVYSPVELMNYFCGAVVGFWNNLCSSAKSVDKFVRVFLRVLRVSVVNHFANG
ncbi:hypothetical protein [Desulfatiferula olefinivorans]